MPLRQFYKYRPLYSKEQLYFVLDLITERRLYLSGPAHFTDPFDAFTGETTGASKTLLSLSDRENSRLLWAHYGGWFSGVMFRLELPMAEQPFRAIKAVEYTDCLEILDRAITEGNPFIKHRDFAHEGEWRLVSESGQTHLPLGSASRLSVILGPSIQKNLARQIGLECQNHQVSCKGYPGRS
jgi:hypothetical protein